MEYQLELEKWNKRFVVKFCTDKVDPAVKNVNVPQKQLVYLRGEILAKNITNTRISILKGLWVLQGQSRLHCNMLLTVIQYRNLSKKTRAMDGQF